MPSLRRSRHYKITSWEEWCDICYDYGIDPWVGRDELVIEQDIGGGDTITYEYIGDVPEE